MQPTIGQIIKQYRQANHLTQKQLAERLNVSPQAVSKWENDGCLPDITLILPMAKLFEISTDTLLGALEI